jgi:hypothetical protein
MRLEYWPEYSIAIVRSITLFFLELLRAQSNNRAWRALWTPLLVPPFRNYYQVQVQELTMARTCQPVATRMSETKTGLIPAIAH